MTASAPKKRCLGHPTDVTNMTSGSSKPFLTNEPVLISRAAEISRDVVLDVLPASGHNGLATVINGMVRRFSPAV